MELADRLSAEHRDLLLTLALSIGERREVDELFASFASGVQDCVAFDFCSLLVVTADPEFVRIVGHYPDLPGGSPAGTVAPAQDLGLRLFGLDTKGVQFVPRVSSVGKSTILVEGGFQRAWTAPLFADGKNYGLLTVGRRAPEPFEEVDLEFLRAAASLLASAVRQDLELEHARRNAARAKAASDLLIAVQSGEAIQDLFQRVPTVLGDCLEADYIGLILDDGAGFRVVAESPMHVHRGDPPSVEGNNRIRELAAQGNFVQFRPEQAQGLSDALTQGGFGRASLSFLRDGEALHGVLMLARVSARKFDSDERAFIEVLRSILTQALANQHRLARTEGAAARARALNEVALLLNAGEDIEVMFERLLGLLDQAIDSDYVGLLEVTDTMGTMRQVGARPELVRPHGERISSAESGLDLLSEHGVRMLQYSLSRHGDRSAFTRAMRDSGMRRAVTVVIHQGDEVQGILSLARKNSARFSEDEEAFLKTLGAMLGQAMSSRQRLGAAQRESARNALLNELGLLLNNGESLEAFFEILAAQLQRVVPYSGLVLMVGGHEPDTYRVIQGLRRQTYQQNQVVRAEDFGETILSRLAAGALFVEGETSVLGGRVALSARANGTIRGAVAAIRHAGETVGFLLLGRQENVPFTADDRLFFELVSALAGQAISNLRKVLDQEAQAIRSRVLAELSQLMEGGAGIGAHFSAVSDVLLQAVGFDFLSITTRDPETGDWLSLRTDELLLDGERVEFDPKSIELIAQNPMGHGQYRTIERDRNVPGALAAQGFQRAASVVMMSHQGTEGLLTVGRRYDTPFTDDEMSFVGLLGALFGQASANHQKVFAREADAARNRVLGELALLVNNGEPIETHFSQLVQLLFDSEACDFCSLMARTPDGSGYRLMRSHELPGDDGVPHPERVDAMKNLATGSAQYGRDGVRAGAPQSLFDFGIERAASIRLVAGVSDEGLLTVGRRLSRPFSAEEMTFFELAGTLLAYAIANERRIAQSQSEAEEQAIIAEAAGAVAREHDAIEIIRSLRQAVSRFIPAPFVSYGYLEDNNLRFPSKNGASVVLPIGEDFQLALEHGQEVVARSDVGWGTHASAEEVRRVGIYSHVLTRAQSAGVATGVLVLGSHESAFEPGPREARLCRLIADIVGPAMVNARTVDREREAAEDQAIVAEAAAAVARGTVSGTITLSLHDAVGRFVPDAFVRFGYFEGDYVLFHSIDGKRDEQPMGRYYKQALAEGHAVVPAIQERAAASETLTRTLRARLQSHIIVRAESAGSVVGFLLIGSRDPAFAPGSREVTLSRMIADVVGPAMANARAAEREREEAEDQAIIAEAAAAVARESSPSAIRRSLRGAVARFIPAPYVTFGFLEADGIKFVTRDGSLEVEVIGEYFTRAFAEGQVMVPATAKRVRAGEVLPNMVETGIQAHLLTTTNSGGSVVGLLLIGSRNEDFEPGPREARLCQLIADIVGPAMANARAVEREREEAENQSILAAAAAVLASGTSHEGLESALSTPIQRFIPGALVQVYFVRGAELLRPDGSGGPFGPAAALSLATGQVSLRRPWPELSAQGEAILETMGINQLVMTKLNAAGESQGLLAVGVKEAETPIGERQLGLLRFIAEIAGPAFANARERAARIEEAEDQRLLAGAASAAAKATDEVGLARGLVAPIKASLPGAKLDLMTIEAGGLRSVITGALLFRGPHFESALEHGESQVQDSSDFGVPENFERRQRTGVQRSVSFRLSSSGEPLGILWVGSTDPNQDFSERQFRLYRLIADMVGPALANLRESERRKEDADEQRFLAEAAATAARATDEESLVRGLVGPIKGSLPGAKIDILTLEGDQLRSIITDDLLAFGIQFKVAFEDGYSVADTPQEAFSEPNARFRDSTGVSSAASFRLSSAGEPLGILWIGTTDEGRPLRERQVRLYRLIADIVGPALANLRESGRRREDAEEQRFLAEAAATAARAQDEASLMQGLRRPFRALIPSARLLFFYLEGDTFRVPEVDNQVFPIGPQARIALDSGQAVGTITNPEVLAESRAYFQEMGIHHWVDTLASSGGEKLGVFFVGTREATYEFSARDLQLFRLVSDIVGPAMANIRESRRRKEDAEEQRILADAAAAIAAGTSELDILQRLVTPIRAFVPRARVAFSYVENGEMWLFDGRHRRPVHAHAQRALDEGQSIGTFDVTQVTEASRELVGSVGVKRWVDTGAHSGGTAVGILFVGTPVEGHEFSRRDLGLIRVIADFAAPAMVNARDEARRQLEAEDERVLSDIAALAARATESSEVVDALPGLLGAIVPRPFALYGIVEGDSITYRFTEPSVRALLGSDALSLPLTRVGNDARLTGQGVGSLAGIPSDRPYAVLGLQEYVLSSYQSPGSPIGMLMVSSSDPEFHFSERLLTLLRRIAQVVGPAVESARAEAERARQAELYGLMLRSLSEGVVLADIDGRVVFANGLGRKILRAMDPEGTASSLQEIVALLPEDTREGYIAAYERGEGSRNRTRLTMNGRDAWFDYELVPLNDPVMKILLVAADVTADVEREAEQSRHRDQLEQAQRLAALGELIGGVAHELNNPLTAILGFAEVMALTPEAAPLSEDLAIIQKEALRARNIVRDLLFIARPGTSERALVEVAELVGHIARLRRAAWSQQGVECEIDIPPGIVVWGNEHQLTQVMLNLVTNAEHALQGRATRRIDIKASSRGDRTEITVSDTGAGMDETTSGRVFEPFFTTKPGLGTGLGLPLSYSIIQAHEGDIQLISRPGAGTRFTITLPSASEAPFGVDLAPAPADAGKARVLVVDDEPSLRKVCQRLIASMGHECLTAENSTAALQLAAENDFDLVLCDYRLAVETADVVVAGLERVAPQLVARTVIATGATTDPGVLALTERHGLRLVAKPYGAEDLASIIRKVT